MSRIGKNPITIPSGVQITLTNTEIKVKGPKGELTQALHRLVKVEQNDQVLTVSVKNELDKAQRALWGLYRSLIQNMVLGVSEGYKKELEINGVGYKAEVRGKVLVLNVGYSHPVEFKIPEGIAIEVNKNVITITGIDKQFVGEIAANIRKVRKPEPYNGKGIKYLDEVIKRKVGKTAGKTE